MLTASFDVDFAIEYGVQEAILVNKFLYLERYTTREDGYCWRTAQELYEETGLTKRQTARAIEHLESLGFLETKNTHINGTSINARHFKLTAMFHEKFESNKMLHSGSDKTSLSGSDKKVLSSINNNTVNKQTIEEVRDILNALDLEKIEQLELCMNNLKEYYKRMELEHRVSVQEMFEGCSSLETLEIPKMVTETVTSFANLFANCGKIQYLDLSSFDTSLVTQFQNMFLGCSSLTSINFGGADKWDTAEGVYMSSMFEGCSSLKELKINKFSTVKVQLMDKMFKGCSSLTTLELNNFDTQIVSSMDEMFSGVTSLKELSLPKFNTQNKPSCDNIWNGITEMKLKIRTWLNEHILEKKPDGITVENITQGI